MGRDRQLLHDILEPELGVELAALATPSQIERLEEAANTGTPLPDVRNALRLLRRSYQWAINRGRHPEDPTAEIDTRWLGR